PVMLPVSFDIQALNRAAVDLAYSRTTTLSANLIEWAAKAQADERLILALDGALTGAPDPTACIDYLAGYGSSSGRDVLAGLMAGIFSKV
ncbi:MAG: DUF2877 domain-containing protein, partial [Chloroflexota bacterium]